MRIQRFAAMLALAAGLAHAGDGEVDRDALKRSWERSLIPLVASQSLDAASSYGYRELNPILAGQNGEFGPKATTVKFAVVGVIVLGEYLLVRKSPKAAGIFQKLNWATSAVTTGFAVRNYIVR
jgi:hypothetical protein